MKARLCALSVLLFLSGMQLASPALADPPARIGRLSYLSGPVSFAPAGDDNDWSEAMLNRPVTIGDRLWTDQGARAQVQIGSTAVRMGERTNVDVLNLDDSTTQLRLAQGTLNLRIRSIPSGGVFEIDTPSATILVQRPGNYRIDVGPEGRQTTVGVRTGAVNVSGASSTFPLYASQQATVYADAPDYRITRLPPPDAFERFWQGRDQHQDRARATRYVPADMTGYDDLDDYGSWDTVPSYGAVWFPTRVAADWAPYRDGRWIWVEPWGWTWVDNAPWGFAPFHYGRWAYIRGRWGWCAGNARARPVYAPALVAFVDSSGVSAPAVAGPASLVGWFPLGYREPYIPWYSVSPTYARRVNTPYVPHPANLHIEASTPGVSHMNYANRAIPAALTVVPGAVFTQARRVAPERLNAAAARSLMQAPVIHGGAPIAPERHSLAAAPARARPPAAALSRAVRALSAPPQPAFFSQRQAELERQSHKPFQVRPLAGAPGNAAHAQAPVHVTPPAPPATRGVRMSNGPAHTAESRADAQLGMPPAREALPAPGGGRSASTENRRPAGMAASASPPTAARAGTQTRPEATAAAPPSRPGGRHVQERGPNHAVQATQAAPQRASNTKPDEGRHAQGSQPRSGSAAAVPPSSRRAPETQHDVRRPERAQQHAHGGPVTAAQQSRHSPPPQARQHQEMKPPPPQAHSSPPQQPPSAAQSRPQHEARPAPAPPQQHRGHQEAHPAQTAAAPPQARPKASEHRPPEKDKGKPHGGNRHEK